MDAAFDTLYKPIFFQEVPPLQNMAISKLIQYIWHNELFIQKLRGKLAPFLVNCNFLQVIMDLRCQKVKLYWNVPWEETQMSRYIFEAAVSLSEQTKIQRKMELCAWNLIREFKTWVTFLGNVVFRETTRVPYSVVELLCNFDEFVYDVYGRIDYEKTAKNLLSCTELTAYHKFIIACIYCFEEKIRQLWPSVRTQLKLDYSARDNNELVQYWIARKTNESNAVLLHSNSPAMFARNFMTTYSSMKYFWKNITTFDEQVNCIGLCFECRSTFACVQCFNYWFPKMNDEFLKCVVSRYGTTIMIYVIQSFTCRKFLLSFWRHTGDMFDGDQFINILKGINAKRFRDFRLICRVLWCNAPTKLKAHVLKYYQIEDLSDPLNYLIKKIYVQNPFSINNRGILLLSSDWIYYPRGCECENDPEEEDCKCETLLK